MASEEAPKAPVALQRNAEVTIALSQVRRGHLKVAATKCERPASEGGPYNCTSRRSDVLERLFIFGLRRGLGRAHFGVELGDGAGDAEAPGEDGEGFEFFRDNVLVGGIGKGNAGFVHFVGLHGEVVKEIAKALDAFLTADGAVAGDEESVFVPGGESLESFAPTGHGALFVEAGGIGVIEDQVAAVNDFLIRNANDQVGAGMAGEMFDDDGEMAEVEIHREFRGIERFVREGQRGFVGQVENIANGTEIALGVLAGDLGFGVLNAFFDGSQDGGAIGSLQGDVGIVNALGNGAVCPELNAVGAVEGTAHGMIEVIVGEKRVGSGDLGHFSIGLHLESRAGGGAIGLEEKTRVFSDEEAAVADGGESFRSVGDGSVKAIADFADRGEAGVSDRSLGDAGIVRDCGSKRGKGKRACECVESAEAGSVG